MMKPDVRIRRQAVFAHLYPSIPDWKGFLKIFSTLIGAGGWAYFQVPEPVAEAYSQASTFVS